MESPLFDYWLNLILRILLVFALGMVVGYKWCEKQIEEEYDDDSDSSDESDEGDESDEEEDENPGEHGKRAFPVDYSMKMVLCVRRDLPMTKGKACAQCCHAAVGAVGRARKHTKGGNGVGAVSCRDVQDMVPEWVQEGCSLVSRPRYVHQHLPCSREGRLDVLRCGECRVPSLIPSAMLAERSWSRTRSRSWPLDPTRRSALTRSRERTVSSP